MSGTVSKSPVSSCRAPPETSVSSWLPGKVGSSTSSSTGENASTLACLVVIEALALILPRLS